MSYHPNYFQEGGSVRNNCRHRLDIIREHIQSGSLLDMGCSEGFYSFGLADKCKPILAIDKELSLIHECQRINRSHKIDIDFRRMGIDELLQSITVWDTCLYLSVHHHIIAQLGMEVAGDILFALSRRCDHMFFDMGQKSEQNCTMHKWWQLLPSNTDQETWLLEYLVKNTIYKNFWLIGSSKIHNVERLLWQLTK